MKNVIAFGAHARGAGEGPLVRLPITEEQAFDAQQAADTAALNGVVYLAMLMRRHDLVAAPELEQLHAMMSKPLTLSGRADNPIVQAIQQHLDEQFATILSQEPHA